MSVVMIMAGFVGFALIGGWSASLSNVVIVTYDRMNDYFFSAMPLFLLMGALVSEGGLGKEAYQIARAWLGQIRGGLAMATIGGSALFAGISRSSLAGSLGQGSLS
jgi:TRAP-type C4-dicarboxylate transport system permease large subunit